MPEDVVRFIPAFERMNGFPVLPGDFDDLIPGGQQIGGKGNGSRSMPVTGSRCFGEAIPRRSLMKCLQITQAGFGSETAITIRPILQLHHPPPRRNLCKMKPVPAPDNAVAAQNAHMLFHLFRGLRRRPPAGEKSIHAEIGIRIFRRTPVDDNRTGILPDHRTADLVIPGFRGSRDRHLAALRVIRCRSLLYESA